MVGGLMRKKLDLSEIEAVGGLGLSNKHLRRVAPPDLYIRNRAYGYTFLE